MAIASLENYFSFVSFANSYLMVCTSKIKLDELFSPTQSVQQSSNQRQRVLVFNCEFI